MLFSGGQSEINSNYVIESVLYRALVKPSVFPLKALRFCEALATLGLQKTSGINGKTSGFKSTVKNLQNHIIVIFTSLRTSVPL